jgi:N-acyl-D-amino-acid deacylase
MEGNQSRLLLVVLFAFFLLSPAHAQDYDLVIRNGRVIDGTGNPAYFADVAVKDGRIVVIGKVSGIATTEVDAKGLVVAPGFIDVHTHAENVVSNPRAENFVRMGVTTIVTGNCGGSALNVAGFFQRIEETKVSVNVATLIGHNTVRSNAMGGSVNRPPTDEELAKMKSLVEQAMKDGAVGISTGLIYLPGVFAKTEEIIELAKVASAYNGIYASHIRGEGTTILNSLNELFRIAREAKIRAEISHVKLSGKAAWGRTNEVIVAIEKARAEGLDVTQDQYVYTASSTGISQLIPASAREGGRAKLAERINNPDEKAKIVAQMKENLQRGGRDSYEYAVIASYRADKSLNGKNIAEAAKIKRGSDSLDDQIELILEIEKTGGASGVFHGINEDDLQKLLQHPNTMIASDSGVRGLGEDVPHPRGYGNNARVLARYVRELKLLRLEDAIRRMTSLPATTFRLKERGVLREGVWADIVVFDPEKIQDVATFNDPHHYATGIVHVFVNGVAVVKDGEHTDAKPGSAVRHKG